MSKKRRKLNVYRTSLAFFILFLIILWIIALLYVRSSLIAYENADIDTYMNNLAENIKKEGSKGNIAKYLNLPDYKSDLEKSSSLKKGYKELLQDAKMSYKKNKDSYDIYADDKLIANVKLKEGKKVTRLGLLTFNEIELDKITADNEKGLFNYDFYILTDYTIKINGNDVPDSYKEDEVAIPGFEEVTDLVKLPKLAHYKVTNLTMKPEIEITDKKGNKIEPKIENGAYYANDFYKTDNKDEAFAKLKEDFDPLDFAEKWSLFLTDDLPGTLHGFYTLSKNFIEDTEVYNKARSWATGVDITFTSIHTLDKETFTNTFMKNFTVYSEDAYSVEVNLEKNMTLQGGDKRVDKMHEIHYYIYYDNAWRLVKMQTAS